MESRGYIKLYRKFFDTPLWTEPREYSRAEAWLDLLQAAEIEQRVIILDGRAVPLRRGELLTSKRRLEKRWGWSIGKVTRFMQLLQEQEMATVEVRGKYTVIALCNYDKYNQPLTDTKSERSSDETKTEQRRNSKRNTQYIDDYCVEGSDETVTEQQTEQSRNSDGTVTEQRRNGGKEEKERTKEKEEVLRTQETKNINTSSSSPSFARVRANVPDFSSSGLPEKAKEEKSCAKKEEMPVYAPRSDSECVAVSDMGAWLAGETVWLEAICMNRGLSMPKLREYLDAFIEELKMQGVAYKPAHDVKRHFNNWLRKILQHYDENSRRTAALSGESINERLGRECRERVAERLRRANGGLGPGCDEFPF